MVDGGRVPHGGTKNPMELDVPHPLIINNASTDLTMVRWGEGGFVCDAKQNQCGMEYEFLIMRYILVNQHIDH